MLKNKFEIFLDTDIFIDHLKINEEYHISALDKSRKIFQGCYTSVINASEIFSRCKNEKMLLTAKDTLTDIGILGIPFRYSLKIAEVIRAVKKKSPETHTGMRLS